MSNTTFSPRSSSGTRRRIAGLVLAGASALTVAGVPQVADAHTTVSTGSPGSFSYASWSPNLLAVGERQSGTEWIPTFHSDGPVVEPNNATVQYVVADYSLQYKPFVKPGQTPSWEEVAHASESRNLASFDNAGAPGTQKFDDVDFNPTNPQSGRYRVEVQIAWYTVSSSGRHVVQGVSRGLADPMDGRLACVSVKNLSCGVNQDEIGVTLPQG
jgi:hypothetical protein